MDGEVRLNPLELLETGTDPEKVLAVRQLLELGDAGTPTGTYLLIGAKAALRSGLVSDAVWLTHQGLKVCEPGSLLWGELLVSRAVACNKFGALPDALLAGHTFIAHVASLPEQAIQLVPHVYHVLGQTYDRLGKYDQAAKFHARAAAEWPDKTYQATCRVNLAYSQIMLGAPDEAEAVLTTTPMELFAHYPIGQFAYLATMAALRFKQGRFREAVVTGQEAEAVAQAHQGDWILPLCELWYLLSRVSWELGDRHQSGIYAVKAAHHAEQQHALALRDTVLDWMAEIIRQGGIKGAKVD